MKNIINYLIAFIGIAIFSSCSDVENEIWINKDGSGKLEVNYDMSSMLEMASMFEAMGDDKKENSNEENKIDDEDLGNIQNFDDIMAQITNPNTMKDIDTTFNLYNVMPDSIKNTLKNPKSFKKMNFNVVSNKAMSIAKFGLSFEYENYDEFTEMAKSLSELDKDKSEAEKSKGIDKLKGMITNYEADLKNGIITIPSQDFSEGFMDENLTGGKKLDEMGEESAGMMQMLFGDASIITKMHLPGEVISCNDPTADIFGNQIRFKDSFIDLMKNKKTKGRVIKFKK
jgi:hypothetical protein